MGLTDEDKKKLEVLFQKLFEKLPNRTFRCRVDGYESNRRSAQVHITEQHAEEKAKAMKRIPIVDPEVVKSEVSKLCMMIKN